MAGYVCTVASGKGGVGKTTAAINLGAAFEAAGHDAVVVDADLGMANLAGMLELDVGRSLHDVLAGRAAVEEVLDDTQGVTVVPGEESLEAFASADPAELRTVVSSLRDTHDLVLVDTGAGLSHEVAVPLGLADGVVLVTTPDPVSVEDAGKTARLTERVDGEVLGVLATRVESRTDIEGMAATLGVPLLGAVPEDTRATRDEPAVTSAPESDATAAYTLLAAELESVFFEGLDPSRIESVSDPVWFGAGSESTGAGRDESEDHGETDKRSEEGSEDHDGDGGGGGGGDGDGGGFGFTGLLTR